MKYRLTQGYPYEISTDPVTLNALDIKQYTNNKPNLSAGLLRFRMGLNVKYYFSLDLTNTANH